MSVWVIQNVCTIYSRHFNPGINFSAGSSALHPVALSQYTVTLRHRFPKFFVPAGRFLEF